MIIKYNDKNWSETEGEQLLTRATCRIYMSKRRKTVTSSNEPAAKKIADQNLQETQETRETNRSYYSEDSD